MNWDLQGMGKNPDKPVSDYYVVKLSCNGVCKPKMLAATGLQSSVVNMSLSLLLH